MNLIYLLGAGRSGTTLLATVLGNQKEILTLGEMHQFIEHLNEKKACSCGKKLTECEVWSPVVNEFLLEKFPLKKIQQQTEMKERHANIPFLLANNSTDQDYLIIQQAIFEAVCNHTDALWYVDSSKYIARYLRLKKTSNINLKGIYLIRDVRGVINSFQKQVQSPKKPLGAIIYYLMINFFAEIVFRLDSKVLKIRYEDFVENPEKTINAIFNHIGVDKSTLQESFTIPHIVGGNRMKTQKNIYIKEDSGWKKKISRKKQILYYILSLPTMLLNKYKL